MDVHLGIDSTIRRVCKHDKKNVGSQHIDQQEILETLYQYTYNFDGKKPDGFAELFTENAVWEIFTRGTKNHDFHFQVAVN